MTYVRIDNPENPILPDPDMTFVDQVGYVRNHFGVTPTMFAALKYIERDIQCFMMLRGDWLPTDDECLALIHLRSTLKDIRALVEQNMRDADEQTKLRIAQFWSCLEIRP